MDKPTYWLDEIEYRYVFSRVPRFCVELVLVTEKGLVLTKRKQLTWKGFWHIPGGSVMYDECVEQAVKRIGKTELGIEVKVGELLGYAEYDETKYRGYGKSNSLIFQVEVLSGTLSKVNEDGEQIKAFKKLPKDLVPEQKEWLEKYGIS